MSHLHIPDGVLPPALWFPGLVVALFLLVASGRSLRHADARGVAFRSAIGAVMLAAMSLEVPLGPLDFHLSLVGPAGVLLGAAAGFQVVFVVNAILALVGHGGITVVGLNALVMGTGVALARPLYRIFARRLAAPGAMASATAVAQAVSGVLWLALVAVGMSLGPVAGAGAAGEGGRVGLFVGVALPLWAAGVAIEALVAAGVGRFLGRVRPDLLPEPAPAAARAGGERAA